MGFPNSLPTHGLRVTSLQVLDTMEGVLGLAPVWLSRARRSEGPRSAGQLHIIGSQDLLDVRPAHRADWIPTRVCLQMTMGTSEVDTFW